MSDTVDTREAAAMLGLSVGTLQNWRAIGHGPQHFVAGSRMIRYRRATINEYINARMANAS